jgi:hypothetical protein
MPESETTSTTRTMSQPDDNQMVDYQSFNIFALVSLVLGLASVTSLFDEKLFWIIPAAGTLMSLYALWTIARGDRAQVGRSLAIVGLSLSLFFLIAAPATVLFEQRYIHAEARVIADQWFEYLEHSDAVAAYDMTLNYSSRAFTNELSDRGKHLSEGAMWDYYERNKWPQMLLEQRDKAEVEYVETPVLTFQNGRYMVRHRYRMRTSQNGKPQLFDLLLERDKDHSIDRWHWRVVSLAPADNGG